VAGRLSGLLLAIDFCNREKKQKSKP